MAKLSLQEVEKIADLAKLDLTAQETEKFAGQLSNVLELFKELEKIDTANIDPVSQTTKLTNITREDIIEPLQTLKVEDALSGTDNIYNNYFVTEPVLQND